MSNDINLDPARVKSAKSRAASELGSARLSERSALAARAKAAKLAEVWGFYVHDDEIGDEQCTVWLDGSSYERCRRPKGHAGEHSL